MKKRYTIVLYIAILLLAVLASTACPPVDTSTPPATTNTPSTPVPTLELPGLLRTPTPTQSPTGSPTPATPRATPLFPPTFPPTPPPQPGVYQSSTYGFSITYPEDWQARETEGRSPVVNIAPATDYPLIAVELSFLPEVTTVGTYAKDYMDMLKQALPGFTLEDEKAVKQSDAPAYEIIFKWDSVNIPLKAKMVFVLRGIHAFATYGIAPQSQFDGFKSAIDKIIYSLELVEPKPYGVGRSQSLTLFDVGPRTLDPAISREASSHAFITYIFGGLVNLDGELNIIPDIARDWEVTGGGKVYLFHLKKGVMFHNGREVTAKDFKYSWERAASPDTKSPTVETYLGDIVGVKDVLAGRSKEIQGVRVIDDYTLEVTIDAPKAYFLSKLTYPVAFVVEKSNVESGTQWWQQPVGTGPFVVLEWKKDELFILARNNFYHGEKPKVENILYRLWGGRPMIMYETGAIDIADIYSSDIDRVRDPANPLAGEMKIFDVASLDYIAFGTDRPPFDDVKVRQAFALAVDKDKIIRRVLKDMYKKADGIIPPGIPGHNPGLKGLTYDVARAKELITSSSYGSVSNFPPITITIPGLGGDIPSDLAAIIQEWKENLGVQVMVRALEPEAYSYIIKEERDEMISSGWVADYPDPENFLDVLFHTDSQANDSGYGNPEIDVLMEAARVEQDPAKRLKMYRDIEQKLVDDGALIPLWFGRRHQLIKPYVQGYQLSPLGYPLLNGVSLSPH